MANQISQKFPAIADLAGDPICRRLLNAWSRRPWDSVIPAVLSDRSDEIGKRATRETIKDFDPTPWRILLRRSPRRSMRQRLKSWRRLLVYLFGDYNGSGLDTPGNGR